MGGPHSKLSLESPDKPPPPPDTGDREVFVWSAVLPLVSPGHPVTQTHCYMNIFTYKLSLKVAWGCVRIVEQKWPNGMNKTLLERNDQSIWYYQFHTFLHSVINLLSLLLQVRVNPIYLRLSSVTICPECLSHVLKGIFFEVFSWGESFTTMSITQGGHALDYIDLLLQNKFARLKNKHMISK